jgi:hypothetical protein
LKANNREGERRGRERTREREEERERDGERERKTVQYLPLLLPSGRGRPLIQISKPAPRHIAAHVDAGRRALKDVQLLGGGRQVRDALHTGRSCPCVVC